MLNAGSPFVAQAATSSALLLDAKGVSKRKPGPSTRRLTTRPVFREKAEARSVKAAEALA